MFLRYLVSGLFLPNIKRNNDYFSTSLWSTQKCVFTHSIFFDTKLQIFLIFAPSCVGHLTSYEMALQLLMG